MNKLISCAPDKDEKYSNQTKAHDISDEEFHTHLNAFNFTWYQRLFQVICFIVFLGPLRIIAVIVVFTGILIIVDIIRVSLKSLGFSRDTGRGICFALARFAFRTLLLGFGNIYLKVNGKLDPEARFIISNHTCLVDPFVIIIIRRVCCVIKKEVTKIKILLPAIDNVDPVYVDRSQQEGKTKLLVDRADDFTRAPVLIFSEGTILDGTMILKLHKSAFLTPYKVQPMLIRYWMPLVPKNWNTCVWNHDSFLDYLFCLFALPLTGVVTVDCLPSITMEKEGKGDIDTFTNAAQLIMANHLKLPAVTRSSHEIFLAKKEKARAQKESEKVKAN